MKKEIVISIIVIVGVVVLDIFTGNYTKNSVENLTSELNSIKNDIKDEKDITTISEKIENLKSNWGEKNNKLAYYIEHDELEKIDLYIVGLDSSINSNEYNQALEELDKCAYILEHLEEKYSVNIKNIF